MVFSSWSGLCLLIFFPVLVCALPFLASPLPHEVSHWKANEIPIQQRKVGNDLKRRALVGTAGLGDVADLFYTVSLQLGGTSMPLNLDTGSGDIWVVSDTCRTSSCNASTSMRYDPSSATRTEANVDLLYGDSLTGTHASGPVVRDTVAVAGLSLTDQVFASVNDTNNSAIQNGGAGIFGLGFPSQSFVQAAVVNHQFDLPETTDAFVASIAKDGPLVARLAMSGKVQYPMFSVTLQRNTMDIGGNEGRLTIGGFPVGVDNSTVTWVPVRLYRPNEGGQYPPTFAPGEVYPLRWEIPLEGIFFDGQRLPDTNLTGEEVNSNTLTALIDTGNSLVRGPGDVVSIISQLTSPQTASDVEEEPIFPCSTPHTLAFQIGGKMFPIDPRDFTTQYEEGDATYCSADNLVGTDVPSPGALFTWNLGDPFFKSNVVIFYYGNLTHPSMDPPRIGFLSTVPKDASELHQIAVEAAQQNGGDFANVIDVAPTAGSMGNIYTTTSTSSADQGADETSSIFSSNPEVLSDSTVLDYRPHPAFCPSFMFWCLLLYIFR